MACCWAATRAGAPSSRGSSWSTDVASRSGSTGPCCGACCASACRRCRPSSPSTCSISSTGSSSSARRGLPRRASTRWRSSSPRRSTCWSEAFSSPGRPLAYSIRDDGEAQRAYAAIVTWFVSRLRLRRRRHVAVLALDLRALAAPEFFGSYKAIGLISTARHSLRPLHGPRRDPRPDRSHRVQLPGDDRRPGRQRRPQPSAGAASGDRRRGPRPGRLLPRRAGADVRVYPATLSGPLRVGAPRARGPRLRGPGGVGSC